MIVATDIAFGEGPRWRDGTLWWSDMHGHQVSRLLGGAVEKVCDAPMKPSGLGWLPDGRMLVVSMLDKRVLRQEPDGSMVVHADLSSLVPRRCNDMTVDARGRAYVGNFGFELDGIEAQTPTVLVRVDPDGSMRVVAEDLMFPNGAVITEDGRTLIIAETFAGRLSAFDIDASGDLSNRRVWAQLPGGAIPDGICLDAEGAVWVASPFTRDCLRIAEGGALLQRIDVGRGAYACMLGGPDRRTLYVCTADSHDPDRQAAERNGAIEAFEVDVAGAGLP
jgi:sugar lactone lactonase YvrE